MYCCSCRAALCWAHLTCARAAGKSSTQPRAGDMGDTEGTLGDIGGTLGDMEKTLDERCRLVLPAELQVDGGCSTTLLCV